MAATVEVGREVDLGFVVGAVVDKVGDWEDFVASLGLVVGRVSS